MTLTTADYVILVLFAIGFIIGLVKGILKQLFAILGVFVVAKGSGLLCPYVTELLANVAKIETTATITLIISAVVIAIVYIIVGGFIVKKLENVSVISGLNKLLGAIVGALAIYLVVSVVVQLVLYTPISFLAFLKGILAEPLQNSYIVTTIFSEENNFFGKWVFGELSKILTPESGVPSAFLLLFAGI